jgi:tRNA A-37 threonylcarbamoyl transferase component Bud32
MIELDYTFLEELEHKLLPVLTRRGIAVEQIQPIGVLGRGASSTVFSLLINGNYHVLKVYYSHTSFLREQRNRRRLIWPPRIVLASPKSDNSLGYDFVITEVPQGISFNSEHLLDWVQEKMGRHLIELHRLRRARKVATPGLLQALYDVQTGALKAGDMYGPTGRQQIAALFAQVESWLAHHAKLMRVESSVLHNDLWWDNIIVANDEVYLIDWESMKTGDYAEDLAFSRVMMDYTTPQYQKRTFWHSARNEDAANRFWSGIIEMYQHEFDDKTLPERLKFYLVLQTLRRLSDIAYSDLPTNHELLHIWVDQLTGFWERGLEPLPV